MAKISDHLREYRLMRCLNGDIEIRETYARPDGTIAGWVDGPASLWGDSEDDVRRLHTEISKAFDAPVLVEAELEQ